MKNQIGHHSLHLLFCLLLLDPCRWFLKEHARSNAQMKRVHDDMGIKKIMFVFGDDFLQRAYSFPWFQQPEWKRVSAVVWCQKL